MGHDPSGVIRGAGHDDAGTGAPGSPVSDGPGPLAAVDVLGLGTEAGSLDGGPSTGREEGAASASSPALRNRYLVAIDVDGTLLDTEFEDVLRQREAAALAAVSAAGHVCALCTGRNSRSLDRLLARTGDGLQDLPQVLLNGAVVISGQPRQQLLHATIEAPTVRRVVEIFQAHGAVALVYDTQERGGVLYHEDREANSVLAQYLARRHRGASDVVVVPDLLGQLPPLALEIGTIDTRERITGLTDQLRRELSDKVRVVNTQSLLSQGAFFWAEVYHRDCSKGEGALLLARHYGIAPEQIIAVGDNYNDLELFAVAGRSVAMSNAPDDVKAAADFVAPPVRQSGAAVLLEEIASGLFPPSLG